MGDMLKDVQLFRMNQPAIELIEYCHPYEAVEDDGIVYALISWIQIIIELSICNGVGEIVVELSKGDVEERGKGNEEGHAINLPPDVWSHYSVTLSCWWSLDDFWVWLLRSQSNCCQSVHDQVNPQQLDDSEN